jgi:IS605 OrfB family transposase
MRYKSIKTKLYLSVHEKDFILMMMRSSKNLYNQALYNVRQHFFETGSYLSYEDNYKILSRESENYRLISTSQGQAVIMKVDEAMKSFFGSLKSKLVKRVRLPRYLEKNGYFPLLDRMVYKPNDTSYTMPRGNFIKKLSKDFEDVFQQAKKYDHHIEPVESLSIKIDTPRCITGKEVKEITIREKYDGKYIEVIHTYVEDSIYQSDLIKTETMSIDFGLINLACVALTNGNHLLLDGLRLKSMNQFYHKSIAKLSRLRPDQKTLTKRMIKLIEKRNNQMTYGINIAARKIMNHAIENNVGRIIFGVSDFKDSILKDTYQQWARSIPLARLLNRIRALAEENGISTEEVNEAYTSQASSIDGDIIEKGIFSGKRTKRGLYVSQEGRKINADLNAALNIYKKGNPDAERIGSKGWNTPKRTYLFGM